ncbi:unnamed protein product [Vicia faba]|uniref:Protein PGR n=1 Tax=Vicia faba TaxID=3906 RepID=A0AAV1AKP4_VICFA|nr:unnamed protein product [Vicia faba]
MDSSHSQWIQPLVAVSVGSFIAFRAHRKNSLSTSGAFAGLFVMSLHILIGFRFAAMLFAFFFTSSTLTKKGQDKKRLIDPEFKIGGQRNWIQVLSNSGIASILVVALWVLTEGKDYCLDSKDSPLITALIGGVIGHYCCCNGDTWSSEIGVLSDDRPRLITTFKHVRKGTNGGVTKTGLLAAAGLGGSIIDSLFGATLQFSGFCSIRQKVVGKPGPTVKKISGLSILDNNAVNFVSILLTTILTSIACLYIF